MAAPLRLLWRSVPARLFVVFLAIYAATAGASLSRHSLAPHFVYLAESFLHGHLDLIHTPLPPYDLTFFAGRWYVSFPPLPALLMLPLVALGGLSVSDIAFSVVMGALNVALFYVVLTRMGIGNWRFRAWLCVLLGVGTPLWYCAALGSVWYTAHVVAITCLCLYALEVMGQNRNSLAGLWLGLGFLARAPVLLAFPLTLIPSLRKAREFGQAARCLLLLALGMAPALLGQAAYNWTRFGSPLEFGYRWMNSPSALLERQATWGQFSLHFLPQNAYTLLIRPPRVSLAPLRIEPDPWGMGLLLTCPALLLALPTFLSRLGEAWRRLSGQQRPRLPKIAPLQGEVASARQRARSQALADGRCLGLWLSIVLVQLPSLLYFNTGSYQFGYRFALDWMPLAILLVALGAGGKLSRLGKMLIIVGVLMHLWGVLWMYPNFNGQAWHTQYVALLRHWLR